MNATIKNITQTIREGRNVKTSWRIKVVELRTICLKKKKNVYHHWVINIIQEDEKVHLKGKAEVNKYQAQPARGFRRWDESNQQTLKHLPPGPPLLLYFSLAIKLPIFQDIKFEFRESQTSCNHSLELQCVSNKSPQNLPKKIQNLLKSYVFARKKGGGKEIMCKGNLFIEPRQLRGTDPGR